MQLPLRKIVVLSDLWIWVSEKNRTHGLYLTRDNDGNSDVVKLAVFYEMTVSLHDITVLDTNEIDM